ncbi:hypothetical protein ACIBTZ_13175 [Micromonospora sp. NPDC049460]
MGPCHCVVGARGQPVGFRRRLDRKRRPLS